MSWFRLGRKHVQTRLVQPLATSINSGDVFILVNDSNLFIWQGKDANVIEKARVRINGWMYKKVDE